MDIFLKSGYFLLLFFFASSCIKKENFDKIEYQEITPGWGVPVLDSKLTLKDITAVVDTNLGIKEESDHSYTFSYFDTIVSPRVEEVFQLPDQSFSKVVQSPFPSSIPFPANQTLTSSYSQAEVFDAGNGSTLKYIDLKAGQFTVNISSIFKNNVSMVVTLLSLLDQKQNPVVKTYDVTPDKPFISENINLQGYRIVLSGSPNETNTFRYSVSYKVTSTGQPLNTGDGIFVSVFLKSLRYSLMVGKIGELNFPPYAGSINLKVFDQASFGNIFFSKARLNLIFENSLGIPIDFTINKLRSTTSYGKVVDITPLNPPFKIALGAPTIAEIGKSKSSTVFLDNSNSGIVDAINPAPDKIEYDFSSELIRSQDNFITDNSQVKVFARIDIPLSGSISRYEIKDTLKIKSLPLRTFEDKSVSGSIDSAVFKLKIENGIPASASTQLYFLDSLYQKVDSLLLNPDLVLASEHVDPVSGEVKSPTIKETVIYMNGKRYDRVKSKAKYFYIFSRINTPTDPATGKLINIKLQSGNSLRIVISVLTKGTIKLQ